MIHSPTGVRPRAPNRIRQVIDPIPRVMTAMVLNGYGDFDQLKLRTDHPTPVPRSGEVLIQIAAAGVNNTDINTRIGWYSQSGDAVSDGGWTGQTIRFPRIQGADLCGRIVATGHAVPDARIGERVIVQSCLVSLRRDGRDIWLGSERDGAFAQFVAVPSDDAWSIISALSDIELASLPCAYGTAENLLTRARVKAGDSVLVTGATGGLGSAAVQLAKRRGAEVIAVVSSDKLQESQVLNADRLVARERSLSDVIQADSLDVVIDMVGGPAWPSLLDLLKPRGRYAVSGAIAGPKVDLDLRKLYLKDLTFLGCTAQESGVFKALVGHIERGEVRPLIAGTYALGDLVAAQRDFLTKRHIGKLVIIPPD